MVSSAYDPKLIPGDRRRAQTPPHRSARGRRPRAPATGLLALSGQTWRSVGLAHSYLGPRGVLNAFVIGLVSAAVYLADGRNLWPLIIAHGLVDTVNLLILRLGLAQGHG